MIPSSAKLQLPANLTYQIMSREEIARFAANKILDVAKLGRGTVLTPGCNTPIRMYQLLFTESFGLVDWKFLLNSEKSEFAMGMIDGIEWMIEHPYSFRYYFIEYFLKFFGLPYQIREIKDRKNRSEAIKKIYAEHFKNIYVPHVELGAAHAANATELNIFNDWLRARLPIDLVVLGLGSDGHIAFLGPGQTLDQNEPAAKLVSLWNDVRQIKWLDISSDSCICTRIAESCNVANEAPERALTISLRTILSSKKIILMATGKAKAKAVQNLIVGDYRPHQFTAHYLRNIADKVTILLDEDSASLI